MNTKKLIFALSALSLVSLIFWRLASAQAFDRPLVSSSQDFAPKIAPFIQADPEPDGPSTPVSGDGVTPELWTGNPSCGDIGLGFGFKLDGAPAGTFTLTSGNGDLTGGAPEDPDNSVTISNVVTDNEAEPRYFDWSSTLGIDAVIVKGGDNANVYEYDPEDHADTGLAAPGAEHAISHIEFCYDYELDVTKDAQTTFTRTFEWSISKSVTPDTWDLFTGDSGTSEYIVAVEKTGFEDSDWAVSGTIFVNNSTPLDADITSVTDLVSPDIAATVNCGVAIPFTLGAGLNLQCTYTADLPDGSNRTNTAAVTTSGPVGGGSATADVVFGDPTNLINDTITVDDSFVGDLGEFSESDTAPYERTFSCDADEGVHNNTATIVETGQEASASVTVNCHRLAVTKDVDPSLSQTWTWTIEKSADQATLQLAEGELTTVNYSTTVSATMSQGDWSISGEILIQNPHPSRHAELTQVSDLVSPDIVAGVDCPSPTVPAGGSLTCSYSAALPDGTARTNTATATVQNYDYDSQRNATPSGTTDFAGTADIDFAGASVDEVDECIDVGDSHAGLLGTVCAGQAPTTFEYPLSFGTHPDADVQFQCGDNSFTNTASFIANDTGVAGQSSWTLNADVTCAVACTLTPGYWKNHSEYGPAPADDTWNELPGGADTLFFLSEQIYYNVLWTEPNGNAYYILAHAYIAAELNRFNGASMPGTVAAAFNQAAGLFAAHTPDDIGDLKGKDDLRQQFIAAAEVLDDYNNGRLGPGKCKE